MLKKFDKIPYNNNNNKNNNRNNKKARTTISTTATPPPPTTIKTTTWMGFHTIEINLVSPLFVTFNIFSRGTRAQH